MELLSLIASVTQRRAIVSEDITDPTNVAPFGHGDILDGIIRVVIETADPTNPTTAFNVDTSVSNAVALTDGEGVTYADGSITGISNGNRMSFGLEVTSATLTDALEATEAGYINAFLEVRITSGDQDILLLREPVIIWKTATS